MGWLRVREEAVWKPTGVAMATIVVAQILLALRTVSVGHDNGGAAMLVAGAGAFASIICVTFAPMPSVAKAALTLGLAATLLLLSATLDPLGARGMKAGVAQQMAVVDGPAHIAVSQPRPSAIAVRTTGPALDPRFNEDLARRVAADTAGLRDLPRIVANVEIDPSPDGPTYRLSLSLARSTGAAWCGRMTITSPARAAVIASLSEWIVSAIDRKNGGGVSCSRQATA